MCVNCFSASELKLVQETAHCTVSVCPRLPSLSFALLLPSQWFSCTCGYCWCMYSIPGGCPAKAWPWLNECALQWRILNRRRGKWVRWKNYDSTMHTLWHKSDANPYPPGIKNTPASKDFLAGALAFLLLHVRMQDGKIRLPVAGERQRPLTKNWGSCGVASRLSDTARAKQCTITCTNTVHYSRILT